MTGPHRSNLNRSVLKRVLGSALAALAVAVIVFFLINNPAALGGWLALGLGIAVVLGMVMRLVRAPKGKKFREGFAPVANAGEAYQQLLLGREPTEDAIEHSFPAATDDTASSAN